MTCVVAPREAYWSEVVPTEPVILIWARELLSLAN
jgi:hypothetical protein